jgi:leader peptidase (prepilin peptidase)/N-methyltransferase
MATLCAIVASIFTRPGWPGALGGGLAIVMMAIAAIDGRRFIIPDRLVAAGLALGLLDAATAQPGQFTAGLVNAALRGLVLALLFFGFRMAYRRIRQREGLGLGDVKLASVAGLWLGWTAAVVAVDVAALSALAAVLIVVLRGQSITRTTQVPFGLFFAPAIWIAWLFEAVIARGMV